MIMIKQNFQRLLCIFIHNIYLFIRYQDKDPLTNKVVYKDLIPNGKDIPITNKNKKLYVKKYTEI